MVKLSRCFLKGLLLIIMLFLSLISLFETQRSGKSALSEILNGAPVYKEYDNILLHVIAIALLVTFMYLLRYLYRKKNRVYKLLTTHIKWFQVGIACISSIISFMVFMGGMRTPVDDQIQVYSAAQLFNDGNFINLTKGGYVNMYPQQLGYILYMQIILRIASGLEFQAIQVLNCFFIAGTVYFACCFLNDLTEEFVPRVVGSLFFLFLLPLYLLVSWVYGDIPFYCFLFLFLHNFATACKTGNKVNSVLAIISAVFCLLFRKHALILLIAALMVSVFSFIEKREKQYLLIGILSFVLPCVAVLCVEKGYTIVSGYEIDGGIPSAAWITMGTIEDESKPGWFNNYSVPLYYSTGCNRELTSEFAMERLKTRFVYFVDNPGYTLSFYKRKICTQWNAPYFNTEYLLTTDEGYTPKGITLFLQEEEDAVRCFLSNFQSIIYLGMLSYVLLVSYKDDFIKTLPEMFILGGFFFSILWEANARYVFPYFLVMLPLAAVGWQYLLCIKKEEFE